MFAKKTRFLALLSVGILSLLFSFSSSAQNHKKIKTIIVDAGHGGSDGGAHGDYEGSLGSWEKNITLAIANKVVVELKKQLPNTKIIPTRTSDITQSVKEKATIANQNNGDLFVCIHADAVNLQTGSRIIGYRTENYSTTTYKGKGRKKKKIVTHHTREVAIREYFKIPTTRKGTSTWIFAAHKTDAKLQAMENSEDLFSSDSMDSSFDINYNSPEFKAKALLYVQNYFRRSYKLAADVQDEIADMGRSDLGINQRLKGIWVLQATQMPAVLIETGFISNPEDERYLNSEKGQQELAEAIARAVRKYKDQVENPKSTANTATDEAVIDAAKPTLVANIPDYAKRNSILLKRMEITQPSFKVDLYDDGDVDGDNITLYYNGRILAQNKPLTDKALSFTLSPDPARKENELIIYADNVGSIPPNTALMVVTEGDKRTELRITSDTKKNGLVIFTKK